MNKQVLALLVIISLAGAAIYYLLTQQSQSLDQTEPLFSDLSERADNIERVEIFNHHGSLLAATRGKDGWVTRIETIGIDYPVDQAKLSELVSNLAEANIFEAKTAKKENYPKLGISDIQSADSQATLINVFSEGKQYSVLVGNRASSGQGSYVRRATETQSWLLDSNIELPSSEFEWLKQPIINIDLKSVSSISRQDEQAYTLKKADSEEVSFMLEDLQDGETLSYDSIVDGFVENIVNLNFEEIVSIPEKFWLPSASEPDKKLIPFSVSVENGDNISMTLAISKNEHFVRFVRNSTSGQSHWDGLSYLISSYSSGQIDKSRDSFIDSAVNSEVAQPVQPVLPIQPAQAIDEGESPN